MRDHLLNGTALPLTLGEAIALRPAKEAMEQSGRLSALHCTMRCDSLGCKEPPTVSPVLFVPSTTPMLDGHKDLRMFTTLHCCAGHLGMFKLDDILTDRMKADFEAVGRQRRPIEFRCNFDAAHLTYIDVAAPAYVSFMAMLEVQRRG